MQKISLETYEGKKTDKRWEVTTTLTAPENLDEAVKVLKGLVFTIFMESLKVRYRARVKALYKGTKTVAGIKGAALASHKDVVDFMGYLTDPERRTRVVLTDEEKFFKANMALGFTEAECTVIWANREVIRAEK